ncbi:MAG: hypothetical protein IJR48_03925, partial [Oscillibacter sp.]|nr:hypothetical protein [Oscillibacter sp.]
LFIASLTGSAFRLKVEPLFEAADAAALADTELSNLLEKFHFEYRIRDALFDGAQTGDYCAHFWFDPEARPYGGAGVFQDYRGEIQMELVEGINVMFGNPADCRVERQPWILLVGRDRVENLRREAKRHRKAGGVEAIVADEDDETALYVLLYTKVKTTVHVTKATREAVIYEDIDTGLSVYPVAWGNWERQRNQYHGRALVTGLIPNQIFINTLFATAMRHIQLMAFPRVVYNADLISAWTNEVGQAIGVRGLQPGQNVASVAGTIPASEMSAQIFTLIDKTMAYTKECLGVSDVQLGSARPENTSALALLQTNAEVSLENIRAGLHEWLEDIGRILLDMMGTCYGTRPVVTRRDGETTVTDFDFRVFKHLWLNLRADVGKATVYNESAVLQTLDDLRRDGVLSAVEYLERVPDRLFPRKAELLDELRAAELNGESKTA